MENRKFDVEIDSSIKKFYENLKTPVFFCNTREVLWHNEAADDLFKARKFRQYVLQLNDPSEETTKVFICDGQYYKILLRPFEKNFFLEVAESWPFTSTFDTLISLSASEILDSVARNSSHQIFQSMSCLNKVLEKQNDMASLRYLDKIANSTYRVLRAVNVYREYNLLLQGKTNLEAVDIFSEIDALCSTVNSLMQKSGVSFFWEVPSDKVFCDIDIHQFSLALFHLICNAYMFNVENKEIRVVAQKTGNDFLRIDVFDHGTGISPQILDKVTVPYFSYDSATGDVAGCGLGLTYVAIYIENVGGTLTIDSGDGKTVVSISLPIGCVSEPDGLSSHIVDYGSGKYEYMVSTMAKFMWRI